MRDSVFIIAETKPARHVVKADSLGLTLDGAPCEPWQPLIHSHVVQGPWLTIPSTLDQHSTALRGVFGLLLSVTPDGKWTLRAYP